VFVSDQLYFAVLQQKNRSTSERHCFCVDDELVYEKYVLRECKSLSGK